MRGGVEVTAIAARKSIIKEIGIILDRDLVAKRKKIGIVAILEIIVLEKEGVEALAPIKATKDMIKEGIIIEEGIEEEKEIKEAETIIDVEVEVAVIVIEDKELKRIHTSIKEERLKNCVRLTLRKPNKWKTSLKKR